MRPGHFDALRPVCPVCLRRLAASPLRVASIFREAGGHVVEGVLHCSDAACQHEYPIVDGIPLIVPDVRGYVASQLAALTARDDLSATWHVRLHDRSAVAYAVHAVIARRSQPSTASQSS